MYRFKNVVVCLKKVHNFLWPILLKVSASIPKLRCFQENVPPADLRGDKHMAAFRVFERFAETFFCLFHVRSPCPLRWARVHWKEIILNCRGKACDRKSACEFSLFNAHTMSLIFHLFMNVNKLCLNQRVLFLVCVCWLANRVLSLKSRRCVDTEDVESRTSQIVLFSVIGKFYLWVGSNRLAC